MKLNAGCGKNKIEGYLNIDINPKVKPDYVMPLWDLDLPDESFDEILSKQTIEHLGFFKTKYFLTESLRILKYEKFLIIETVDIEESFKLFLESKSSVDKERVLNWIFGSETKYMNHLYCFPKDLLTNLLNETGFEIVEKNGFFYERLRPVFRVVAVKRKRDLMDSRFRKFLVKNGLFDEEDEIVYFETERIIKSIHWDRVSRDYLFELCFLSPIFSYSLSNLLGIDDPSFYKKLIDKGFTGYLFKTFKKYFEMYLSFDFSYNKLKDEFFDNPYRFIYNFMEDRRDYPRRFMLSETILKYEFLGGKNEIR